MKGFHSTTSTVKWTFIICIVLSAFASGARAQSGSPRSFPIARGWSRNQINTVIFRKNSLISHGKYQYAAFYNEVGKVVLAKRRLGAARWDIQETQYVGDVEDAHKSISIAVDGTGFLHVVWNQHNSRLQYCRSRQRGSLELSAEVAMIGDKENEYAVRVPEGSDLINQTSMYTDAYGRAYIATYWRVAGTTVPQLRLVYSDGRDWSMSQITHRREPFTLRGEGTRRIPLSRPLVILDSKHVFVIFRDAERGNRITVARSEDLEQDRWSLTDLSEVNVGLWEPTYDPIAWVVRKELHLLVQKVGQGEAESLEKMPPQMVSVVQWKPQ
jgi:hypothetical protein